MITMKPQQGIVERLDFVAKRIPGLKITTQQPGDEQFYGYFMSCDMFYIEIKVDQSHKSVEDVIISHSHSPAEISCPVLRKVLAEQDFETFAKHLSGLHSIYQINTNRTTDKQKAYPALMALESDLSSLYERQRRLNPSCHDLVHKSPIGVMEPRKGGLPVKLTYFITPYDLVDASQKSFINLNVENIIEKNLGLSATVEIEGSTSHKIQIKSLITQNNQSIFGPFTNQNSEKLPAQFVLKLSQPIPILNTSISQIITEINQSEPSTIKEHLNSIMTSSKDSIISLIARQELDLNKGLFGRTTTTAETLKGVDAEMCDLKRQVYSIKLPDQHHTYHIIDNYLERPEGVYIEKIPFTHPSSIPSILKTLRQQALFNFVIGSCIRRNKSTSVGSGNAGSSSTDENNSTKLTQQVSNIFDVLPVSLTNVCISFEHPSRESLATVEIDFKDIVCRLYALDKESVCSDEFATKTLQRCWSIPVTLRSVLRKCNETRLALLENSNKRRERELQELLATNSSTNHQQPSALNLTQETLLQSRSSTNVSAQTDKATNPRDLNSIAEFLSNKVNNLASAAVDRINQAACSTTSENNRTTLLKKFSCKPKVKQTTATTKNQTGNKILSLMLKRQSSSTSGSSEDPLIKGPVIKKAKTKNVPNESTSTTVDGPPPPVLTTTKLISPDQAMAARLANIKQQQHTKQTIGNSALKDSPISLIKAPKPPSGQMVSSLNVALSSNASNLNQTVNNIRLKSQMTNGISGGSAAGKARKSSIGAVLDRLVGNVTPEQQSNLITQLTSGIDSNLDSIKGSADSSKLSLNGGPKKNSKAPGGDQFAIKQGSSGGGLKLTVTKTKPSTTTTPLSSISGPIQPHANPTTPTTASASSISTSAPNSSSTTTGSSSSSMTTSTLNKQSDASKILELGSVAPSIRYTIPKISKSQTASQSTQGHQTSSDINSSSQNEPSVAQTGEDSANPSSSVNQSSAASSTTTTNLNKRTTSNPFNRNIVTNRNSVSSSTHPPNRTTSNPLASALSNRPSSSTNNSSNCDNNNHALNRMNNQNLQQRHSIMNRSVNLLPQPHFTSPSSSSVPTAPNPTIIPAVPSSILNPSSTLLAQQQAAAAQLIRQQPALSQMFSLRLPQQTPQNIFSSVNDLNLIASQVALLNQQQQLQQQHQQAQQLQLQQQVQQHIQQQQLLQSQATPSSIDQQLFTATLQSRVTSSSEAEADNPNSKTIQSNLPSSTPSSPTECGTTETVVPPPLIPIDSLEEAHPGWPDVDHDDESDRLSIVDMNEHAASDSTSGTPKPSGVDSPMAGVRESSPTMGSPSLSANHRAVNFSDSLLDAAGSTTRPLAQPLSSATAQDTAAKPETSASICEPLDIRSKSQNPIADVSSDAMDITQSPQSSIAPSTTATSNLV